MAQTIAILVATRGGGNALSWDSRTGVALFRSCWPIGLLGLLTTAYYRVDSILVYRYNGPGELGYYSAAYRFIDVAQLLPMVLVAPLLTLVVRSRQSPTQSARLLELSIRYALICGVAVAAILAGCGNWVLRTLYGPEYEQATPALTWLGVAFIGICLGYVGTTACVATGLIRKQLPFVAILAVASLAAQIWAIPRYGITSAAIATAASEVIMATIGLYVLTRQVTITIRTLNVPGIVAAGVISAVVGRSLAASGWCLPAAAFTLLTLLIALGVITKHDFRIFMRST